jgi:hypothetical protein
MKMARNVWHLPKHGPGHGHGFRTKLEATGWNESFYGDLHIQGKEGVIFYTRQKVVSTRWFSDVCKE